MFNGCTALAADALTVSDDEYGTAIKGALTSAGTTARMQTAVLSAPAANVGSQTQASVVPAAVEETRQSMPLAAQMCIRDSTAAIRAVINGLVSRKDSQGQMEDDCVTQLLACSQWTDPKKLAKDVERVTPQQVSQMAQIIELDTVYRLTGREGA